MFDRLIQSWNTFWFSRLDARPLAMFRIAIGGLFSIWFLFILPNWHRFFAGDGIVSLVSADFPNDRVNGPLSLFHWTEGWLPIEIFWPIAFAFCLAFTFGFCTRISTFGLLLMINAMVHRNPYIVHGEELVIRMCLLYCLFMDLGSVWSIDAWRRKQQGKTERTTILAWPIRMMQINICLIYLISLPFKFYDDAGWVTGDAFHWTVASEMWGLGGMYWITLWGGGIVRKLFTFYTVIIETLFPTLVWFKPCRRYVLAGIAALHIGIGLLVPNVSFFTFSMVCTFMAFLAAEDVNLLQSMWMKMKHYARSFWIDGHAANNSPLSSSRTVKSTK